MKIVFVLAPGTPKNPFFAPCIQSARLWGGVPVVILSDIDYGDGTIPASQYCKGFLDLEETCKSRLPKGTEYRQYSMSCILRWMILGEYLLDHPGIGPVMTPDWDMMFFQNVEESYAPFLGSDFAAPYLPSIPHSSAFDQNWWMVPNGISNVDVIVEYRRQLILALQEGRRVIYPGADWENHKWFGDMPLWSKVADGKKFSVADTNAIFNGSYFDPCMVANKDKFLISTTPDADEEIHRWPRKTIRWIHGKPHFISRSNMRPIRANTVHLFGPLKDLAEGMLANGIAGRHDG